MSIFTAGNRVKVNVPGILHHGEKGTVVASGDGGNMVCLDDGLKIEHFRDAELDHFTAPKVERIIRRAQLTVFAAAYGLRDDWSGPDSQNISAEVRGMHFDNTGAWGTDSADGKTFEELHVALKHDGEPVALVNLATLFAWAVAADHA